jgi:hypothetical protein
MNNLDISKTSFSGFRGIWHPCNEQSKVPPVEALTSIAAGEDLHRRPGKETLVGTSWGEGAESISSADDKLMTPSGKCIVEPRSRGVK